MGLLHFLALLFLAVLIDLTDYRCKELLLVGLARVKLDTLGESLASASLNEGREERVRGVVILGGWRITAQFVRSRGLLILGSRAILQPVLRLNQFLAV